MNSVLLVDDDPALRGLLRQMLELGGFVVHEAEDGLDALDKLTNLTPDVLVLDVMMPNMDGVTLCKRMRNSVHTMDIPIIMLSGKTQDRAVQEGLDAGASKYLKKPISFTDLISHVKEVILELSIIR